MKRSLRTIVQRVREKPPIFCLFEIVVPAASKACLSEINQKLEGLKLWLKTSTRNPAHDAIEPPICLTSQRLCSILVIVIFGRESVVSSLFGCGISSPVARRHLSPNSSHQPSRRPVFISLPYENEMLEIFLVEITNLWDDDGALQQVRSFFGRN